MKRLLAWVAVAATSLLSACSSPDAPSEPPANVAASPGDTSALVTWTNEDGNNYWVFYAEGTEWTYENRATQPGYRSQLASGSPLLISGLTNGKTYQVLVAKTSDGSPAGPTSAPVTVTPRIAGSEWTLGTPLPVASLNGVAYGNSLFVAVGSGGAVFTSPDGISWTARASNTTNDLNAVAWVNGRFAAVGANGTAIQSANGVDWGNAANSGTRTLYGVAEYGESAIAVGAGGTILSSTNSGISWNEVASGTTNDLYAAARSGGRMVVAGAAGTLLYSDNPLLSWQATASGVSTDLRGVGYGAGVFAVVGPGGTALWSGDGVNFGPASVPAVGDLRAVSYGSQFAAIGASGAAIISQDGKVWSAVATGTTETLNAIGFGLYRFSAVGSGGTNLVAR